MNRPELLARAEQIAAFYGQGGQIRSDVDSWLTNCPAHEDSTPSLHITVTDKILVKCHGGCAQTKVINQMKADGMWVQTVAKDTQPKTRSNINIPAHRTPDLDQIVVGKRKPTQIYTYVTEDNEPAFWVLRIDEPGKPKIIRPYSSVHYDDGDRFELALNCTVRPLYRLNELINSTEPVMVVEGEKTVDAAQKLFPDYMVTTWSGGTGGVKKSVWLTLKDREVVLWPDNDPAGIRAMMDIASILNAIDGSAPKIVFTEVVDDLPEGWDLADEVDMDTHSPELLLSKATTVDVSRLKTNAMQSIDAAEWIKKYADKYVRVLEGGSLSFYNLKSMHADMEGTSPYVWLGSTKTLYEVEPTQVFDVFTQKQKYAIDYWLEDITQPTAYGMVYDPSETSRLLKRGDTYYLNTFPGFAHPPEPCDPALYEPFLNHLREVLGDVERNFFMDYVAHMVQHTTQKPGVMIIFTGKPGAGKTIICDIVAHMLGKQNAVVVDSAAFTQSNFNGLFSGKLFVTINELNVAARNDHTLAGKIRSWITDENYTVNAKFQAQRNERSYHRFMATTNSDIPFPIDSNDRRIAIFSVSGKHRNNFQHFVPIFKMMKDRQALSGLMSYFSTYKIKADVSRPPDTEARSLSFHGEDPVIEWLFNILATGVLPKDLRERLDGIEDWAQKGAVLPRSVVVESVIAHTRQNLTPRYVTTRLFDHLCYKNCPADYTNNQRRFEIYDRVSKTYVTLKDRAFELLPLPGQREFYEKVTGQSVDWPEINVEVPGEESNVVPFTQTKVPF